MSVSLSKHKFAVDYLHKNTSFGGRIVLGIAIRTTVPTLRSSVHSDCPGVFLAYMFHWFFHVTDYSHCQAFADAARAATIEVIRYASIRDPA